MDNLEKPNSLTKPLKRDYRLFLSIWTRPTSTLAFVLAHCPDRNVALLLALGGLARVVDRVARQHDTGYLVLLQASPGAVAMGALSGWLTLYLYGGGLSLAGNWLGGRADSATMRTVLAWALVPGVAGLGAVFLYVAYFGQQAVPLAAEPIRQYAENNVRLIHGICSAWVLVILSKGIQLVQGFSPLRALVNMLLPGALVVGAVLLLAQLGSFW